MSSSFLSLILFTLLAGSAVNVAAYSRPEIVQRGIERRMHGDVQLVKRFSNTRWTFFDVGLGACGQWNVENDFIVALNAEQFGSGYPGPNCFRTITMSYHGKTAQARIMDRCPGCPYGGLDLSRGLFRFFDIEDKGVIHGEWHFGEGAPASEPAPTTTAQAVVPTTSSAPPPPPPPAPTTSTYVPPPPAVTPPAPQVTTTSVPAPAPQPKPTASSSVVATPSPPPVAPETTTSAYVPQPPPALPTTKTHAATIPSSNDAVSKSTTRVLKPTFAPPSIASSSPSVLPTTTTTTNTTNTSTSVSTSADSTTSAASATVKPASVGDLSAGDLSNIKTIGELVLHLFNLLISAVQPQSAAPAPAVAV